MTPEEIRELSRHIVSNGRHVEKDEYDKGEIAKCPQCGAEISVKPNPPKEKPE